MFFSSPILPFALPVEFNYLEIMSQGRAFGSHRDYACVCVRSFRGSHTCNRWDCARIGARGGLLGELRSRRCVCCSTDMIRFCPLFFLGGRRPGCMRPEVGEWFDERPIGGHVCTVGFYQMLSVHPVTYWKFLFFSLQKGSDAGVMARKFVPSNMTDKLHDTEKIKKKRRNASSASMSYIVSYLILNKVG